MKRRKNLPKIKIIILLLLFSANLCYSQDLIIGQVLNERTGRPVNKAFIEIERTERIAYSNRAGYFQLAADSGDYLLIKCPGYFDGRLKLPEENNFKVLIAPSRLDTAEYYGGNDEFVKSMGRILRYPSNAIRDSIEGKIFLAFGVDPLGKIINPHCLNFISKDINEAVLEAFNEVPVNWIPADSITNFVIAIQFVIGTEKKNFENTVNLEGFIALSEIALNGYVRFRNSHGDSNNTIETRPTPQTLLNSFGYHLEESIGVAYSYEDAKTNKKEKLVLRNTGLEFLPNFICDLEQLTYLDIRSNKITLLPNEIEKLHLLKELIASANGLTSLPHSFVNLKALNYLVLENNRFEEIPNSVFYIENLEVLNLANNNISVLPDDIASLKNLKILDLRKNKVTELPESLKQLQNLEFLYLKGNKISKETIRDMKMSLKNTEIVY